MEEIKIKCSIEGEHSKNLTEQKQAQKHTPYIDVCVCILKIPFHCIDFDSQHSKYVRPYNINTFQHLLGPS